MDTQKEKKKLIPRQVTMTPTTLSICVCIIIIIINVNGQKPPGIVELDGFSFPKIVDGSHNVIIKFGDKYSYGDETLEQVLLFLLISKFMMC